MSEPIKILVLWCQPDTMSLWGIPYRMRPGQQPYDIWRAHDEYVPPAPGWYGAKQISLADWVWLGSPGWWGDMPVGNPRRDAIETFVKQYPTLIPNRPCEWTDLTEFGRSFGVDDLLGGLYLPGE